MYNKMVLIQMFALHIECCNCLTRFGKKKRKKTKNEKDLSFNRVSK